MKRIRYLGFSRLEPYKNMAIDEMLFMKALERNSIATFRFFTFNKRCISIGRNQRPENLPTEFLKNKIEIVKRPTGGGAVLHDDDLCYSIVMPESYLGINNSLLASYGIITNGLKTGFELCGINVEYGKSITDSAQPLCFDQTLSYELTINGKKLVGSAQRRSKGILLQQGSIINAHKISQDKLIKALLEGLRTSLGIEYVYEPLTEDEIEASKSKISYFPG